MAHVLRMKLTDFMDTEYESRVIDKINHAYKETGIPFAVWFWVDEDYPIDEQWIETFSNKWRSNLTVTFVKLSKSTDHKRNDYVFFNMVTGRDKNLIESCRFEYVYNTMDGILEGLDRFEHALKFCFTPKPPQRKQKRND